MDGFMVGLAILVAGWMVARAIERRPAPSGITEEEQNRIEAVIRKINDIEKEK